MLILSNRPVRLLVLVVGRPQLARLARLVARLPPSLPGNLEVSVLAVAPRGDGSFDANEAASGSLSLPLAEVMLLPNPANEGDGADVKLGLSFAVAEGFEMVAVLSASRCDAPEALGRVIEPIRSGIADAVLGCGEEKRSLADKWIDRLQGRLLGAPFSRIQGAQWAFSAHALRSIPFQRVTSEAHFETELVAQLILAGLRIVELPLATPAAGAVDDGPGLRPRCRRSALESSLLFALHCRGLLYQRRYDIHPNRNDHYLPKLGYASSHTWALDAVPAGSRVLDIGAGPGDISRLLVGKGCRVTMIDRLVPTKPIPGVEALEHDLDGPIRFDISPYDYLLLLDILEHLRSPERFLDELSEQYALRPQRLIVTLPNVAFIIVRFMLLLGQFNHGKMGVLDLTHTRYFSFSTAKRLLEAAGVRVLDMRGIPAPFPRALGNGRLARALLRLNLLMIRLWRGLFSYQIFIEAETTPAPAVMLAEARRLSAGAAATPSGTTSPSSREIGGRCARPAITAG